MNKGFMTFEEQKAFKEEIMRNLHSILPGKVVSYDSADETAEVQLMVSTGEKQWPMLKKVPVFLPDLVTVNPDDFCLVLISDISLEKYFSGRGLCDGSKGTHSLSDGFALVGFHINFPD